MGVGRFICVGMPFALTNCSVICILIVMLAGVTNNGLYMFSVDTKDLSIPVIDLSSLGCRSQHMDLIGSGIAGAITSDGSSLQGDNVTAADFGLFDSYTISLWNYCYYVGTIKTCIPAKFDWAVNATAFTTNSTNIANASRANFTNSITNFVKAFDIIVKWTKIIYIIASLLDVIELMVGIFAFRSHISSCCTFIASGFFTAAIIAAATLFTFTSTVVIGTAKALEKYSVLAAYNTSFLAISWLAVDFLLVAGLLWLFSICCCAPSYHR